MNFNVLTMAALGALLAIGLGAIGAKTLREFSRRQLEILCRRFRKRALFTQIIAQHEEMARSADLLRVLGWSILVLSSLIWNTKLLETRQPVVVAGIFCGVGFTLTLLTIWLPLAVVEGGAAPFVFRTWNFWRILRIVFAPLLRIAGIVENLARRIVGKPQLAPEDGAAFEDEIRTIVTAGLSEGLLKEDAREMIEGVIELSGADVSDIMTPRSKMDAMDASITWEAALRFVTEVRRTRIPVFDERLDKIRGVLNVKDLLLFLQRLFNGEEFDLADKLREAWFVPATMPVDAFLRECLQNHSHMAIVVDEYQSVAGVVTIEDALEEIVGEIVDEEEQEEAPDVVVTDDKSILVSGQAYLDDLNDELGLDFPEPDDYDTISGLVIEKLNRIPQAGETVRVGNAEITVLEVTRRKIDRVKIIVDLPSTRESA